MESGYICIWFAQYGTVTGNLTVRWAVSKKIKKYDIKEDIHRI